MQKLTLDLLEARLEIPWKFNEKKFRKQCQKIEKFIEFLPIMSIEIEFDDICRSIMGREMIVVDISLPPPSFFVDFVSFVESCSTEMRWLPMAYKRIYRKWHCVCKESKKNFPT